MPHTESAKKRLRQNEKRRARNRAAIKGIKQQTRKVMDASKGSPEDLQKEVREAIKKLDKAAARRVIHPNTAARRKSKLAKLANTKKA